VHHGPLPSLRRRGRRWRLETDRLSVRGRSGPTFPTRCHECFGAITIDPTDASGNTIYVGTGEPMPAADSGAGQGIYKSTDGGDSWSLLAGSAFAVTAR